MTKIAYLLHRFPRVTDTFIMRELRALQKVGMPVQVISVWKPQPKETTPEVIGDWAATTKFLLPGSVKSIVPALCLAAFRSPARFAGTLRLALNTCRPGLRGLVYQFFYFIEAVLAAEVLRKTEVSHVHNHFGDHSGIVTMLAAKLAGIGYSISFHGPHVFFDGKYARLKEKVSHARFTRCISYFCRSQVMLFSENINASSLKVIHCGLDLGSYQYRPPREKVERIYCAARLVPEKGFEFLIRALRILKDRNYNIELRIVGDGPSRSALQAMAQQLEVSDRVQFLGQLDEAAKMRELCASDLFVLPSLAEGLSGSATEAMAVGVPVIATNIAGMSELIEHGNNGLLVRPSDAQALADAVIRMAEDYGFRTRAAELGRGKVVEEFDVDKEVALLREHLLNTD